MTALFVYLLGIALHPAAIEALNIMGSTRGFIFAQQLEAWLRVGGSIAVVLFWRETAVSGLLMAQGAAKLIAAGLAYSWLAIIRPRGSNLRSIPQNGLETQYLPGRRFASLRTVVAFAAPLAVGTLLAWGNTEGYKYALAQATGIAVVGVFVANFNLVLGVFGTFDAITSQGLMPEFWRVIHTSGGKQINPAVQKFRGVYFPLLLSVTVLAMTLLLFMRDHLINKQYHVGAGIILLLCLEEMLRLGSNPAYFGILARGNTGALITPYLAGAVLAIGLTFLLARLGPLSAPAIAVVVSSGIQSILIIRAYRRSETGFGNLKEYDSLTPASI